ncbi:MAG: MBL fold metallo-hydrolase, partial [Clostridia bacterium]
MAKRRTKRRKAPKITLGVVILALILVVTYFVLPAEIKNSIFGGVKPSPKPTPTATIPLNEGELKIHFIDVGQGDSIIIQLPDGKNMMIDGGDKKTENYQQINAKAKSLGITKFDYLMLTHSDADHVGGLDDVLQDFDVIDFYVPKITRENHPTQAYGDFLDLMEKELKENKGTKQYSYEGMKIQGDGYVIDFYMPNDEVYKSIPSTKLNAHQINSVSPIIVLTFDGRKVMFTGDTNLENEEIFNRIHKNDPNLDVDVLKVAHHGSSEATTSDFLKITKPEYGVIMCGKDNTYGHPHKESTERLKTAKTQTYRTDLNG